MSFNINQREVYLLPFIFDESVPDHPYIVLSVKEANDCEGTFIAVMITSSDNYRDDYSFDLTDEMFESPLPKENSHARMHLLTLMTSADIIGRKINTMRKQPFEQLMKSIGDLVFDYQFKPNTTI